MNTGQSLTISISTSTIVRIVAVLLGLWFLYLIRDVIAILFVSLILASAFDRSVDWLQRHRIPRPVGILGIYVILLGSLSLIISALVPPLIEEIRGIAVDFPAYWERVTAGVLQFGPFAETPSFLSGFQRFAASIEDALVSTGQGVFGSIISLFGGVISFIFVLVMTFYMTVSESAMKGAFKMVVPNRYESYLSDLVTRMQQKIGAWLQGQLVLSLIIAALVYLGLTIIGVKYALLLAILAGLLEFIPYVGPLLAAIPAIFFGATQSWFDALLVLILYVVVQQLENHLIVPAVMRRAVGIHPILSITAMLTGAKLFGFVGILMAIPVVTAVSVWVGDLVDEKQQT